MRRNTVLAAVSWLALVVAAGPALAQDAPPLAVGDTVEGEIDQGDLAGPDALFRYDAYRIEATAGQRLEAIMRSTEFDVALEVVGPGQQDPLAFDDDGLGEGTDSRLRFTAAESGTYELRARSLAEGGFGAYTLSLGARPAPPPARRPGRLQLGQTATGDLGEGDAETEDALYYHACSFRARAGDRLLLGLDSDDFDPVVRVGTQSDGAFVELAVNDDGPNAGLNSRLLFVAPQTGDYVVRATPFGASSGGTYRLSLEQGPEAAAAEPIAVGGSVEGALEDSDPKSVSGSPADRYRLEGRAGQRLRVDMTSTAFDTYLELFDDAETSLATDDDGGRRGTDSRLIFTLPSDGVYLIEARAFSSGTGAYRLSVEEMAPEQPPARLGFGPVLEGRIDEDDSRDDDDRGYDAYVFAGQAGQRVQAIMRSGDFDTYLQIGRADGAFSVLASDDDGLGEGTDSRLNFTLPEDGDYVLRASPLGLDGEGLYSLELIDRGQQPRPGSILVGATARGTLSENDATAENNSFYDAYQINLKAEEKLIIWMVSNEVDSLVRIGRERGDGGFEDLGADDDGLSDTHSRLEWEAPSDGVYEIRAGSFQQGETGAYALIVEKQP